MVVRSEQGESELIGTLHCDCSMSATTGQAQNPLELRYLPRKRPDWPGSMVGWVRRPPCTRWKRCWARFTAGSAGEKAVYSPE